MIIQQNKKLRAILNIKTKSQLNFYPVMELLKVPLKVTQKVRVI